MIDISDSSEELIPEPPVKFVAILDEGPDTDAFRRLIEEIASLPIPDDLGHTELFSDVSIDRSPTPSEAETTLLF